MSRDNFGAGPAEVKAEGNRYNDADERSSKAMRQFAHTGSGDPSGGNLSGDGEDGNASHPMLLRVAPFQGRSGQPDNQDIHRPKGST
jgi:hypothetical protein